ncbi:MAG TPA: hypothetical protein VK935_17290 [Actinomycetospora sp.]|nr:hypothetical protein [Actinomycetospora sp.]
MGGAVDHATVRALRRRTENEAAEGITRVVLDIRAAGSCSRAGLVELARLRGRLEAHPECVVDVVGVHWAQFDGALTGRAVDADDEPDAEALRDMVRELRRPLVLDPYRAPSPRVPEGEARPVGVDAP